MNRRNSIAIIVVIFILCFDVVVYKYQGGNCSKVTILRCYPIGEISPSRDSYGNIQYDSVYITIK